MFLVQVVQSSLLGMSGWRSMKTMFSFWNVVVLGTRMGVELELELESWDVET